MLLLRPKCLCWGVSICLGKITPVAWNTLDQWWIYVNVVTSVYPFPIFQGMNCHLATRDLCNRTRNNPGCGGREQKKKKKPQMFSRMFESCQMGVHYFFPCLRNVLGNISGTDTSPGLHSQWCGEEHPVPRRWVISHGVDYFNYSWSYGAELPVGSPVGLPGTLPVQQWAYTSAGRMCSEVRTLNEERWLQEKEREMTETE